MITAWRRFRLAPINPTDARLKSAFADYAFDGPISTTCKPWSETEWREVHEAPEKFLEERGFAKMCETLRSEAEALRVLEDTAGVFGPPIGTGYLSVSGFHAYKRLEDAEAEYPAAEVIARVSLFGKVVEHERGYRAEKLRMDHLILPEGLPVDYTSVFSKRYDCEVSTCPTSGEKLKSTKSNLSVSHLLIANQIMSQYQHQLRNSANWSVISQDESPPSPTRFRKLCTHLSDALDSLSDFVRGV